MAAAAIFDFEKLMPFHYYLTDLHQTWWECYDTDVEHISNIGNDVVTQFKMAVATVMDFDKLMPFLY